MPIQLNSLKKNPNVTLHFASVGAIIEHCEVVRTELCPVSQDGSQCALYLSLSCILKEVNAIEMFGNNILPRFSGRFICMFFS